MDKKRLMEVLNDSTCLISKGEKTKRKLPGIPLLLWGLLVSVGDTELSSLEQVDCQFIIVGVNRQQAERHREEFVEFLETYPEPVNLSEGPTYKHLARVVGDELTALRIFGLGRALGVWDVLLPEQLGVDSELADEAADLGLVVTTGYRGRSSGLAPRAAVG